MSWKRCLGVMDGAAKGQNGSSSGSGSGSGSSNGEDSKGGRHEDAEVKT